ncbi:hypothetical protein JCM6882_005637 [Rhodosporidiobolus microsporus]
MSSPGLVLPAPPPAPGTPAPSFQRLPSSASTLRGGGGAPPSPAYPPYPLPVLAGDGGGEEEPSVDDITRELSTLSDHITAISSACTSISTLRDALIASSSTGGGGGGGVGGGDVPLPQLEQLAALTTSTGGLILALSGQLLAAEQKLSLLRALVSAGRAAALPSEVSQLDDQLEILRSDAARGVAGVKRLAAEEEDAEESARRRLEERVRRENVGLNEAAVEQAVRAAFEGERGRVEGMDLLSYAGRVALESPFTELAALIDDAKEERASLAGDLSRTNTRLSTATTLVGTEYGYGKLNEEGAEGEGDEDRLLAGKAAAGGAGGGTLLGDIEAARKVAGEGKMSVWRKLRVYWREYLLRIGLLVAIVGFIVGIVVYEAIAQKHQNEGDESNSSSAAAAEATQSG